MRIVSADDIERTLTYPALIDALAAAFQADIEVPPRHHHVIASSGFKPTADATLLLMPAWTGGTATERYLGCKIVTVFPDNAKSGRPSVYGSYFLHVGRDRRADRRARRQRA